MSFFANISDVDIGGTYMTFLMTLTNLGGKFPETIVLYLIDWLTFKKCKSIFKPSISSNSTFVNVSLNSTINYVDLLNNTCSSKQSIKVIYRFITFRKVFTYILTKQEYFIV